MVKKQVIRLIFNLMYTEWNERKIEIDNPLIILIKNYCWNNDLYQILLDF